MTRIDIDGEENAHAGLMALVVTVVDLLVDAMEREAIRRMEGGRLSDEEIERLGSHLASLEAEIDHIAETEGIEDEVARLRADLDGLVNDAVRNIAEEEGYGPIDGGGTRGPSAPSSAPPRGGDRR